MNMNIEGLDYNTQREKLMLPGYGRELQKMVDYAMTIEDRIERQVCAETIIDVMRRMFPQNSDSADNDQKLWDYLAIMSDFKLDIDYPYDVSQAKEIYSKPEPMEYPMSRMRVKHYGKMLFEIFEKLKTMEAGIERDKLVEMTANQMKRDLYTWSSGSGDNEKVASDLAHFTDGKIQLDLNRFRFEEIVVEKQEKPKPRRRK